MRTRDASRILGQRPRPNNGHPHHAAARLTTLGKSRSWNSRESGARVSGDIRPARGGCRWRQRFGRIGRGVADALLADERSPILTVAIIGVTDAMAFAGQVSADYRAKWMNVNPCLLDRRSVVSWRHENCGYGGVLQ
jgi:hypothetical protein